MERAIWIKFRWVWIWHTNTICVQWVILRAVRHATDSRQVDGGTGVSPVQPGGDARPPLARCTEHGSTKREFETRGNLSEQEKQARPRDSARADRGDERS